MTASRTYLLADGTKATTEPVSGQRLQPGDQVVIWCDDHAHAYQVIESQDPVASVVLEPAAGGGAIIGDRAATFWRVIPDGAA
jgi:hypothetical protein